MAAKGKGREIIKLLSTAKGKNGKPTKHFYTKKVRRTAEKKLKLKKYDPIAGCHAIYEQTKLK